MSVRVISMVVLSLALSSVALTPAAQAGEGKGNHKGGPVAFILKHADDLKLTADQKTALEALAKEAPPAKPADGSKPEKGKGPIFDKIKEILTPDQMTELKALREKEHAGKPKPPATN